MIRTLSDRLLLPVRDFLFISSCFHCGRRLVDGERRICRNCWDSLKEVDERDRTYQVVLDRFRQGGAVDQFEALYFFEKGSVLQSLAHALKYEEMSVFGMELGVRLGRKLKRRNASWDLIVPVPLNKQKERERGYNQSAFIAKGMSTVLGIPVAPNLVRRTRYTVTQTHLSADERAENVSGAFAVANPALVKDSALLIVDDIITTGSTIQEVARTLRAHCPSSITTASAGLAMLDPVE